MNYWWVNHKQTHVQEIEGGYIWSPKNNRNGARNQTYLNLAKTHPGDIIYSYADGKIMAIGIASSPCVSKPKPEEFGRTGEYWGNDGWLVHVDWDVLPNPVRPKLYMEDIAPLLPSKYSPLQRNGNGNQGCYLASINQELHELLISLAQDLGNTISIPLFDESRETEEEREIEKINSSSLQETEKEQLVKSRRGQGVFRLRLSKIESKCRVTGTSDPRFLVASHIKPWRKSSNKEKLDGNNGFLLAPHVDKLFDGGWITFGLDGALRVTGRKIANLLISWGIDPQNNVGTFNQEQRKYLEYHHAEVFAKNL